MSNPSCKANFIDYNYMVDQILQMSLPYSETSKAYNNNLSQLNESGYFPKENSLDRIKDSRVFPRELTISN